MVMVACMGSIRWIPEGSCPEAFMLQKTTNAAELAVIFTRDASHIMASFQTCYIEECGGMGGEVDERL
jgi:hypothetical protein